MQAQAIPTKTAPKPKKKFRFTIKMRNAVTGYMFLLPWLIGLFVFTMYPTVFSFMMSYNHVSVQPGAGVQLLYRGFDQYVRAFAEDIAFKTALMTDVKFLVQALVVVMVFSLLSAMMLNGKFLFRGVYRLIFFMPVVILSGPILLEVLGRVDNFNFMGDSFIFTILQILPEQAFDVFDFVFTNLMTCMWFSGVQILIFLAGLQKIDRSLYEAAEIDGASKWECFWKITLPYMKNLIMINAIYTIIEIANFAGTRSLINDTVGTSPLRVNAMNPYILGKMTESVAPYTYSSALSWIYFVGLSLILLLIFGVFMFFDRRD